MIAPSVLPDLSLRIESGLINQLTDDDDVQAVFSNFEVDEETMKKMTAA